jgi:hypothetical protein
VLAVCVLAAAACTSGPAGGGSSTKTATQPESGVTAPAPEYVTSTDSIANPERGFYRDQGRCDRDDFNVATLSSYRDQDYVTLVMCDFYLTKQDGTPNLTVPIRPAQLTQFKKQAATVRAAGAKMIVRFAYTDQCVPRTGCVTAHDAAPNIVQAHLNQLAPILRQNSDVIAVVQSGFVGQYGEGAYSDHFGNAGHVSPAEWANRKAIVDKLLAVVPGRMVQVRTPLMKRTMYGNAPVSFSNAYSTAPVARVGHHNDCFLRNPTDSGTYVDPSIEMPYLASDSTYVAVGGETCGVAKQNEPPDRTECPEALPEMEQFHYSYLNQDYSPDVIQKWRMQGCKSEADQRLGYRFSLVGSLFPTSVKRGSTYLAQIAIRNNGWATPFNFRPVFVVLRNMATGTVSKVRLSTDPRRWQAGTSVLVAQNIGIPDFFQAGEYELLLSLPDPAPSLAGNPDYAIRMATNNVWEPTTGFNKLLRRITVTAG